MKVSLVKDMMVQSFIIIIITISVIDVVVRTAFSLSETSVDGTEAK